MDIPGIIMRALLRERRPPDGMLHPSSDLIGSLRHAQLTAAGAPTIESPIAAHMPLQIGTLLHRWVGDALEREGIPVMREVNLQHWLPEGWNGTADFLFFDPQREAWVLADLKSSKGESYKFIRDGGAKEEHIWQVSAYWHALVEMGFEMVNGFGVIYLPKNDTTDKNERVELLVQECDPLPRDVVWGQMEERWEATSRYLSEMDADLLTVSQRASLYSHPDTRGSLDLEDVYVTEHLADVQERVQKMWWQSKTDTWDVKLVPHWSADYCPFPNELCDCSEQGTNKIGHWKLVDGELVYEKRKGYEEYEPLEKPSPKEVKKRCGSGSSATDTTSSASTDEQEQSNSSES